METLALFSQSVRVHLLRIIVLLCLLGTVASAQNTDSEVSVYHMEALRPVGILLDSLDELAELYPGSPAYVVDIDYVVENVMRRKGYTVETYKRTLMSKQYVILDHSNKEYSTVTLDLQDGESDLVAFQAQVVRPTGELTLYDKSDLQWVGTNRTTAKLVFENIEDGAVVHIVYESKEAIPDGVVMGFIPLQYSVPVRSLDVRVLLPDHILIRFKHIRDGYVPHYTESKAGFLDLNEFHFTRTDIAPVVEEPFSPYLLSMTEYAAYMIAGLNDQGQVPEFFSTSVGAYIKELVQREGDRGGVRYIRRFTQELLKKSGAETQDEKIQAILSFVRNNMSENPSVDKPTYQELVETGQGDKWTITELLRAMLDHARVSSEYVVIHDARFGHFDKHFADASMRTPALRLSYQGESVLCFPYLKNISLGVVPPHLQGETAYAVRGYGGEGTYDTLRTQGSGTNGVRELFDLTISEDGKVLVKEVTQYAGAHAYSTQQEYVKAQQEHMLDEFFGTFATYDEGEIDISERSYSEQPDSTYSIVIKVQYEIDNLVTILPSEVVFQTGGLLSSNIDMPQLDAEQQRKNPIFVRLAQTHDQRITISTPKHWRLHTELKKHKVENEIGSAQVQVEIQDGQIHIHRLRSLNKGNWSASEAHQLYALLNSASSLETPSMVFIHR